MVISLSIYVCSLFFSCSCHISQRGHSTISPHLLIFMPLCETAMGSSFFFFFLLSESGTAELPLLLAEAFCSLAGKYSGCELFSFCVPKYELAFIIYYSLQYLNSDLFFFLALGLERGCLRVFCFVIFFVSLPVCIITMT